MHQYLDCPETGRLVRKALKEAFPSVKFSVRSMRYTQGGYLVLNWTDGPTIRECRSVVSHFAGDFFNGRQDYRDEHYPLFDGLRVCLGVQDIDYHRHLSREALERAVNVIYTSERNCLGQPRPELHKSNEGEGWKVGQLPFRLHGYAADIVIQTEAERMTSLAPLPSPTARRMWWSMMTVRTAP